MYMYTFSSYDEVNKYTLTKISVLMEYLEPEDYSSGKQHYQLAVVILTLRLALIKFW